MVEVSEVASVVRAGSLVAAMVVNDEHTREDVETWLALRALAQRLGERDLEGEEAAGIVFWAANHDVARCTRGCNETVTTSAVMIRVPREIGRTVVSRRGYTIRVGMPSERQEISSQVAALALRIVQEEYLATPYRKINDGLPVKPSDVQRQALRVAGRRVLRGVKRDIANDLAAVVSTSDAWFAAMEAEAKALDRDPHFYTTCPVLRRLRQLAQQWFEVRRPMPPHGARALLADLLRAAITERRPRGVPDERFFPRLAVEVLLSIGDLVELEDGSVRDPVFGTAVSC